MEDSELAILGHLAGAVMLLVGSTLIPGLAMVRLLDPTADRTRRWLLSPALGLLALYGLAGWSVIVLSSFSAYLILIEVGILNLIGALVLRERDILRVRRLTVWEKLELALDREQGLNPAPKLTLSDRVEKEVSDQTELQSHRGILLPISICFAVVVTILPLFVFRWPHGIDWVGFATLSDRLATTSTLTLPTPNVGHWTYPPAFPAIAALLQLVLGLTGADAVHLLGQLSLLILLLGIAGAADRLGAGGITLVAMGLGAALFAKAHDSGYPTVASQLGLVLGLLVLIRPGDERRRHHDIAFALGVISVAPIHPTGSIYLGTLLLSHLLLGGKRLRKGAENTIRITFLSIILLSVAVAVVTLIFAPELLEKPIFAEYGWQGGFKLLVFNGPWLVGLGLWAAWRFRHTFEGLLLGLWLLLQWVLTLVHLLDGFQLNQTFALLSYSL